MLYLFWERNQYDEYNDALTKKEGEANVPNRTIISQVYKQTNPRYTQYNN